MCRASRLCVIFVCVLDSTNWDRYLLFRPFAEEDTAGSSTKQASDNSDSSDGVAMKLSASSTATRRSRYAPQHEQYEGSSHYHKSAHGHDHYDKWPKCSGQCHAGVCTVQQFRPGCCYITHQDDPGRGYAAAQLQQQQQQQDSLDAQEEKEGVVKAQPEYYGRRGGYDKGELYCWRGEEKPYGRYH